MASDNEELQFNQGLLDRTRRFRQERNMTQEEMATLLGVPLYRYSKYETRSVLPPYLYKKFCLIVDCTVEELVFGVPRKAKRPEIVSEKPKSSKRA